MHEIDLVKEEIIKTALNKMFKSSFFDICTIDKVAKIMNLKTGGDTYLMLSALHCIHYSDMSRTLYDSLPGLVMDYLSGGRVHVFELTDAKRQLPNDFEVDRNHYHKEAVSKRTSSAVVVAQPYSYGEDKPKQREPGLIRRLMYKLY